MYNTLISVEQLNELATDMDIRIVDCRYDLADVNAGRALYQAGHIPGAVFADVHDDLSSDHPVTDNGRHPLPDQAQLNALISRLGITEQTQVVVYDDMGGAFAARLWWLLRYMQHENVALLDGGWSAWLAATGETESGINEVAVTDSNASASTEWLITLAEVTTAPQLIDSRDPARYRGEHEPIDRIGGHIPGADNHFWQNNLDQNKRFKQPQELKQQFNAIFKVVPDEAVFYCGSGVTACHNLLAVCHAGLAMPRLYAGSWSEWCSDEQRPVATGENP